VKKNHSKKVIKTLGEINGTKLTIFSKESYNIYDIAFIEIKNKEINIRHHISFIFFVLIGIIYLNCSESTFYNSFWVLTIIYFFSFSLNLNPKKHYLRLSFKNFKTVLFSIKKNQLTDAAVLIELYKKAYQNIDKMQL
jgi:hypothetical protein